MIDTKPGRVVLETNALLTEEDATLMRIVELFETGAENIYLVDRQERYRWRAAQRGRSRILGGGEAGFQILMYPLEPIIFGEEINQGSLSYLMEEGERVFARNPEAYELPVVNQGGRLSA